MAMTKDEHENLLKEIASTGGDTDNMLKLLQRLRDDFDEREGMLRRDGESTDKERPSKEKERERIREESREDNREDKGLRRAPLEDMVPRRDYDELKRKYIERFFSGADEAMEDQKEDVRKDDKVKNITFDDLFKEREGK